MFPSHRFNLRKSERRTDSNRLQQKQKKDIEHMIMIAIHTVKKASFLEYLFECACARARTLHSSQRSFHFLLALLLLCTACTCALLCFIKCIKLIFSGSKVSAIPKQPGWLVFRSVAKSPEMATLEEYQRDFIRIQTHMWTRVRARFITNGKRKITVISRNKIFFCLFDLQFILRYYVRNECSYASNIITINQYCTYRIEIKHHEIDNFEIGGGKREYYNDDFPIVPVSSIFTTISCQRDICM